MSRSVTTSSVIQIKFSYYLLFTRSRKVFATRFTANNKYLERLSVTQVLGVWIADDGSWSKNTQEILKKGYKSLGNVGPAFVRR